MNSSSVGNGSRANALWGRGGRGQRSRTVATRLGLLAAVTALAVPASGVAATRAASGIKNGPVVPAYLIQAATANPLQVFHVIVQGTKGVKSSTVASDVGSANGKTKKAFSSISGVSADVSGKDLLKLTKNPHVLAVTLDQSVKTTGYQDSAMWRDSADVSLLANDIDLNTGDVIGPAPQAPAVAIVDSGVDASKLGDFGSRVVASVNLCSICTDTSNADLEGHGTMVAGILAGSNADHPGVAQNAPIVSIRTANADGASQTSDVVAAVDWILANKAKYNIRVANFSMAGSSPTSIQFDPIDKAVERLWFAGVTVVAAAGNFGTGTGPVDMSVAPANDPFVITVGALDQQGTTDPLDDTTPSWSAYGQTADGFSKPDISAPGRYLVMPVPMGSSIPNTVPDRVVAPGYMWMSGTSFAAPVVAGAAAQILARHPDWTPDQVKGALMLTANYVPNANGFSAGVGAVDGFVAAYGIDGTPPNPNENLDAFVTSDSSTGGPAFDQAAWSSAVSSNAAWSSAAWSSAAWSSAAWSSAAWSSAAWSSAAWSSNATSQMTSMVTYSEATLAP